MRVTEASVTRFTCEGQGGPYQYVQGAGYSSVGRLRRSPEPSLRVWTTSLTPAAICAGPQFPQNLVHFHTLCHDGQTGRSTRFFGDQDVDPEFAQLLPVVAALRAVPPVTARTEFAKDLRERLMDGTLRHTNISLSAAASETEGGQ